VALGHSVTAYKVFARIKSASISPDGMLGGRGYVLQVKEVRAKLQQACELLSAVTDTMHDEINAPHWKPKLGELGANDAEDILELLGEADDVLKDPEAFGDKGLEQVEEKNDGPKGTSNALKWKDTEEGSQMPGGEESRPPKETSKLANSSVPVTTLPGPRVDHLDRGEQLGPGGSYNRDEPPVEDAWGLPTGDEIYEGSSSLTGTWGVQLAAEGAWGAAALPDGKGDGTATQADDFGLGYGAKGQGSQGYGTRSPDGHGVWGPASGLPHDPKTPTRDPEEGATPYLDGIGRNVWACDSGCSCSQSKLPFDGPDEVARSDYYREDRGNQFNVNRSAWRPVESDSTLPGDQGSAYNFDRDLPDVGGKLERQDVPYVKYDWGTHQYRHDKQDLWGVTK